MANELTGDFDVAAELSLPAVNRFLAAMHQAKKPVPVGKVDSFGDPVVGCSQEKLSALEGRPIAIHNQ